MIAKRAMQRGVPMRHSHTHGIEAPLPAGRGINTVAEEDVVQALCVRVGGV